MKIDYTTKKRPDGTYSACVYSWTPLKVTVRVWLRDDYPTRGQAVYHAKKARNALRARLAMGPIKALELPQITGSAV